ncbi:MAG: RNA-binding protein [Bacteroidota bacterium]
MIKLFVVGFPLDIEDAELIELFAIRGLVHSVHLITDKNTHKHKGYGFIEMVDQEGADRAIEELNGLVLKGRKITVKMADEERVQKPRTFRPNHFPGDNDNSSENKDTAFKTKRPRKLISN